MSLISQHGRHRKPRRSRTTSFIRGGVLTGVMGTFTVAASGSPALAAESEVERTSELPVIDGSLTSGSAQAAESLHDYVATSERHAARDQAIVEAQQAAAEHRVAAEARAAEVAAERRAEAEAERQVELERERRDETAAAPQTQSTASPDGDRTELTADDSVEQPASTVVSGSAASIVEFARAQVGKGYTLGATGPSSYDCSGLTQSAFAAAGVSLPRTSQEQSTTGTPVSLDQVRPGDILYWGAAGSAHHVAIYVGDGMFVGAQNSSTGVVERELSWDTPTGAVRVL